MSTRHRFVLVALLLALASTLAAPAGAQEPDSGAAEFATSVHAQATLAAKLAGVPVDPTAQISCSPDFFSCTCNGAFDCAWLAYFCGGLGGVQGFDGECFLPDAHPGGKTFLAAAKLLVAEVHEANALPRGGRTAKIKRLRPAVRKFERDLSELAIDAALSIGAAPPTATAITCTPDLFHCGCDGAIDCAWLSWFCGALGGVGTGDGCYLPSLGSETEKVLRQSEQSLLVAEQAIGCQ